jgi:NAD(P)-dependent dehydrogenase (short-subunit alcohol dehydrogenase family)
VVAITGGSAGLGRAIAREFARNGCKVAVLARGQARLTDAEAELVRLGSPKAIGIACDVADAAAVEAAAGRVESELGPLDIWAVVWAATHRKRELIVGQQTSEPADPDRPDNLDAPVGGAEIAAHGHFDTRARAGSGELWLATHKPAAIAAGAALAAAGGVLAATVGRFALRLLRPSRG